MDDSNRAPHSNFVPRPHEPSRRPQLEDLQRVAPDGAVQIVAPAGAIEPEVIADGRQLLEALGFRVYVRADILERDRWMAGSVDRRVSELHEALGRDDIAVIWCARGGYGSAEVLPELDVATVRRAGKWLIGFSDITALHALWFRAGLPSVHGPNVGSLVRLTTPSRRQALVRLLRERVWDGLAGRGASVVPDSTGRPMVGGNLTVLASLLGTPYWPAVTGAWLALEDVNEPPYRLHRTCTQLTQAGVLAGVHGVFLGSFETRSGAPWWERRPGAMPTEGGQTGTELAEPDDGTTRVMAQEAAAVVESYFQAQGAECHPGLDFGHHADAGFFVHGLPVAPVPTRLNADDDTGR